MPMSFTERDWYVRRVWGWLIDDDARTVMVFVLIGDAKGRLQ